MGWTIFSFYSLLRPFLRFSANQFAQKFKFLVNLILYFVNICNIYYIKQTIKQIREVVNATIFKGAVMKKEEKTISRS